MRVKGKDIVSTYATMSAKKLSLANICLFKNFIRKKKVFKKINYLQVNFLVFLFKIRLFAFHSIFGIFFIFNNLLFSNNIFEQTSICRT